MYSLMRCASISRSIESLSATVRPYSREWPLNTSSRNALALKARRFADLRMPFLHDLAVQTGLQEIATGFGGLAVIAVGAWLAHAGRLDAAALPLLTLLALSAFVPLWEVAQVGRQLADTLGAARRLYAVDSV